MLNPGAGKSWKELEEMALDPATTGVYRREARKKSKTTPKQKKARNIVLEQYIGFSS